MSLSSADEMSPWGLRYPSSVNHIFRDLNIVGLKTDGLVRARLIQETVPADKSTHFPMVDCATSGPSQLRPVIAGYVITNYTVLPILYARFPYSKI